MIFLYSGEELECNLKDLRPATDYHVRWELNSVGELRLMKSDMCPFKSLWLTLRCNTLVQYQPSILECPSVLPSSMSIMVGSTQCFWQQKNRWHIEQSFKLKVLFIWYSPLKSIGLFNNIFFLANKWIFYHYRS